MTLTTGQEWVIDAFECEPARLRDQLALAALFEELISKLHLKLMVPCVWHTFPEPGGITGMALLSESHLTIHTFPELSFAALNLYCCRARSTPDFQASLAHHLKARRSSVRPLERGEAS